MSNIDKLAVLTDPYLADHFSKENRHEAGLEKAVEILEEENRNQWDRRRERLLEDKIDTTEFIVDQIQDFVKTDE